MRAATARLFYLIEIKATALRSAKFAPLDKGWAALTEPK
jgi:hypothetical protein